MTVDGKWDLNLNSPMGAQAMTFEVATAGDDLTGNITSPMGAMDITDGKVDGDTLSWKVALTQPMPITLEFSGKVDGDSISGQAQLGTFGSASFSGSRSN